jgi:antitoxin MazE
MPAKGTPPWRWSMVTKVQRWGNSQGLRLSRQVLEDARISVDDDVDVAVRDGVIVVTPASGTRGRQSLRRLVARIPRHYKPEEIVWGAAVGREAW